MISERNRVRLALWAAGLLPHWLVMWASIRLISHATTGKYGDTDPGKLSVMDALKRWEQP